MDAKKTRPAHREIFLYLLFGGLTTLCNIGCYYVFARILLFEKNPSNIAALVISVLFAYVTNKCFVFASKCHGPLELLKEFTAFIACRAFSAFVDVASFFTLVSLLAINDMVAKVLINVLVVILNYVFSKLIVFARK